MNSHLGWKLPSLRRGRRQVHPDHLLGKGASKNSQDLEVGDNNWYFFPGTLEVILYLPAAHTHYGVKGLS